MWLAIDGGCTIYLRKDIENLLWRKSKEIARRVITDGQPSLEMQTSDKGNKAVMGNNQYTNDGLIGHI